MTQKLNVEKIAEKIWYTQYSIKSLTPLTLLYNIITTLKKNVETKFFNTKQKRSKPVIIVGNITSGGTGKTPFTIHLTKVLQKIGLKTCVISKGYKGKFKDTHIIQKTDVPNNVGDEALLIKKKTNSMVVIGKTRHILIQKITKQTHADIIICDDGMQDYKLHACKKIALIDGYRHLGNRHSIPKGPLRENLHALCKTDINVVNNDKKLEKKFMIKIVSRSIKNAKKTFKINIFKNKKTHVITALGNPNKFFHTLKKNKINIKTTIFKNHYTFLNSDFKTKNQPIIVTEKDSVKLKNLLNKNIWTVKITFSLNVNINTYISKIIKNR